MRDYRFRYSVEMRIVRGNITPMGWSTRSRAGNAIPDYLKGVPTDAKLARYVQDYNESLKPGGVNEQLGDVGRCYAARIIDHDNNKRVVATWKAESFTSAW